MTMEDPDELLRRLRLGREEYVQRLLTMLIVGGAYPKWNQRTTPSPQGRAFLASLHELSFGERVDLTGADFVDELDLPALTPDRTGGAPDWAVLLEDRLWIIELKTERGSHRRDQLPTYFELACHHYPSHRIDITYLTGPGIVAKVQTPPASRFTHVTWHDVVPLARAVWEQPTTLQAEILDQVERVLTGLHEPWSSWRERHVPVVAPATVDLVDEAMTLARATATDGAQRALDRELGSLEELKELRVDVRQRLRAEGVSAVTPWLWNAATTDGSPMTAAGRRVGYELRFSRSRHPWPRTLTACARASLRAGATVPACRGTGTAF